jgi:hypothetical protein
MRGQEGGTVGCTQGAIGAIHGRGKSIERDGHRRSGLIEGMSAVVRRRLLVRTALRYIDILFEIGNDSSEVVSRGGGRGGGTVGWECRKWNKRTVMLEEPAV